VVLPRRSAQATSRSAPPSCTTDSASSSTWKNRQRYSRAQARAAESPFRMSVAATYRVGVGNGAAL
jgi:hypothetical protein